MNILDRFRKARALKKEQHSDGEVAKKGNLRAGSSGIMTEQGEVAGSCVRKSHLRSLGIDIEDISEDKYIMFELGYANEDVVYNQLKATLEEGEVILREEEIPVSWRTGDDGLLVTGRPDIVLCQSVGQIIIPGNSTLDVDSLDLSIGAIVEYSGEQPVHSDKLVPMLGLELKSVHSLWTARDVLFGGKPKLSNVIQAAHYMWKLNIPYKLIYKSYSQLGQGMVGNDSWVSRMFPKMGEPMSQYVAYNEDKGTIKHIKQFEIAYDLKSDEHGRVHYKPEASDKWTPTIVTLPDIQRYFEFTAQIGPGNKLGPKPAQIDLHGKKAGYKDCSYCPLEDICIGVDKKQLGYEEWLRQVQEVSAKVSAK